jgi:hypothetical protein
VAQDPSFGDLREQGTAVNLVISSGSEGGFKRISIDVELPDVDRDILIQALQEGNVVWQETFNPQDIPGGIWSPAFQGMEGEILHIEVTVDGQPYKKYELDMEYEEYLDVTDGGEGFDEPEENSSGAQEDDGEDDDSGFVIPRDDH